MTLRLKQVPQEVQEEMLAKMAALVRDQPTITVRQLASHLGFAEARSIYYWLKKAGYQGIRDFREDLLRSAPVEREADRDGLSVPDRVERLKGLPVKALGPAGTGRNLRKLREPTDLFPTAGRRGGPTTDLPFGPVRNATARTAWFPAVGADAYALTVEHTGYAPEVLRGDILIVDPNGKWRDGDIVIVERSGGDVAIGRAYGADPTLVVHLIRPEHSFRLYVDTPSDEPYRVAPVVQLIRSFR